jgi:hypothetical protein
VDSPKIMRNICEINHHHHHMALQHNLSRGLPLWGFVTVTSLQGWIFSPVPNPQPGGPGIRIYDPQRQGGPAVPPGTGYPFWSPFTICMVQWNYSLIPVTTLDREINI